MARPSPTAAFLLLLLLLVSLLAAAAHCRTLEADPATDASAESTALVEAGDETVPAETGATTETEVAVPAEQDGFLRLPSHRLHRHPCHHGHIKGHFWWALRHGVFHDGGHRFHHHHHPRGKALDHIAVHEERRGTEEVESVAEPDPDRSVADGHDEEDAAVKPWKEEMLWRMFRHGLRHHRYHHHPAEAEEEHEQENESTVGVKLFRHHHHDSDEVEGEEQKMRRPFHFHHRRHHDEENKEKTRKPFNHGEDSDSDDEDDEVEEMIRRFRKAIMRQRFGHGRRFHHRRHHQAEEAEQADGESQQAEEGGVVTWIKGLMNRF